MDSNQAKLLLPATSVLEVIGVLTLITNEGAIVPKVADIGFTVPTLLPSDIQGFLLFIAGSSTTLYAVLNMKR